ncbi:hypothetical protein NQ317_005108 [Molorchus minor]|uniref:C2H2-type domain-containing protein n=1 Tax=Molorchus minor TaxID=1323400 RepID=A0ABQ9JXL2_9CUCU|nr:hypothetical protein NQ317_005108 [Molorchus minor]
MFEMCLAIPHFQVFNQLLVIFSLCQRQSLQDLTNFQKFVFIYVHAPHITSIIVTFLRESKNAGLIAPKLNQFYQHLRQQLKVHYKMTKYSQLNSTIIYDLCSDTRVCGQKLMTPGSLYNHMRRHNNRASFMCRFCAKLFLTAGQLNVHERIHTQQKDFVCDVCGKRILSPTEFNNPQFYAYGHKAIFM